jgi:hypothetical protein
MDTNKLFFGEVEKHGKEAHSKYMAARGKHGGSINNEIEGDEDLKEYDTKESEEE